ncbi:MAG TPA: hypothetical protein VN736_17970 [Candidatus Limnocylindrales bacterium]|nr:hypothetical protein [Candidatus Limnocylindrales bacterium]
MGKRQWMLSMVFGLLPSVVLAAHSSTPVDVTVGNGLEIIANVTLDEPAPAGGLEITIASSDPARLKFSRTPEATGTPQLKLTVREGYRGSPDFYIQGFGNEGKVAYSVTASGLEPGTGTVTLAPSGIVFARSGMGLQTLLTTTGAGKTDLIIYTALLDEAMNFVRPQPVAGGHSVTARLASSDVRLGAVSPESVTIEAGAASASAEFRPLSAGNLTISASAGANFSTPAQFGSTAVTILVPGMAITDDLSIGQDLEAHATLSLGETAPAGGVVVTITSGDPSRLLLSKAADAVGSECITASIPAGGVSASFYLQSIANSGSVTYTATAPGFRPRTATVNLTPSGVVLGGPQGPPDEAELLSKEIAEGPHGFVTRVSAQPPDPISVYAVQLDPATHRGADLTVQAVRAGAQLRMSLHNTNPSAGAPRETELTIPAGKSSVVTRFVPAGVGTTVVSVTTPAGHVEASNSTSLTISVKN